MKTDEEMLEQIRIMMGRARETLQTAQELFEHQRFDDSASRAYYAVFHVLQALLLTRGLTFSRHSSVTGAFNKEFVRAGVFSTEFPKMIERLFKDRQIGDYAYDRRITENECEKDIADAQNIVQAIQNYLETELGAPLAE